MDLPINKTLATEVILLGFSKNVKINFAFFCFFSIIYLVTIFGNGFMVCVVIFNSHLHTPMYFFLCNLACIDFFYSSRTVPKLLVDLFSASGKTTLKICGFQVYVGLFLGGSECLLLVVMAYDRYVAICKPLYYRVLMRWSICYWLVALVWFSGFMTSVILFLLMPMRLCNPNQLNHYTCEVLVILKMSCYSAEKYDIVVLVMIFLFLLLPFILILLSYACIISSVVKMHSAGKSKAFSTCFSHVTVVLLFYGTILIIHPAHSSKNAENFGKYMSVFYAIINPMLNPLIYSLKNKEITKIFYAQKTFLHHE